MKATTTALKNLIKSGSVVRAVPILTAEWEHNRFSAIRSITVSPTQASDLEWSNIYSLQSVTDPNRPSTGIAKARFGSKLKAAGVYRDTPDSSRLYVSTDIDVYKYWSSTQVTSSVLTSGAYPVTGGPVVLTLIYDQQVVANKLIVGFETTYAKPSKFTVEVSTNGTTWTTVPGTMTLDAKGQLVLWRNSGGTWVSVQAFGGEAVFQGIRLTVTSMDTAGAHVDVLQMGLRLEDDLTDSVQSYSKSFETSDPSVLAPVGGASSNTASVTLNNMDGRFNNENQSSDYFGLVGKRAKFTLDLSFDATSQGGGPDERVREFTMWTDTWGGTEQVEIEVSLVDSSALLQEVSMPKVYWTDLTIGAVIWQTMDIIGMSNYSYSRATQDTGQLIPYFYPDKDTTVWDTLSSLSEGTQTSIYFDEWDVLQIKTRKAMFAEGRAVDWNLDAIQNGTKLPDVIEAEIDDKVAVNKVDVTYKPAHFSDSNNGNPKMESVWTPEDTVTLRASALVRDLLSADTSFYMRYADATTWPWAGSVDIRGEVIRYNGKEYAWHGTDGFVHYDVVKTQEEQKAIDAKSDPNLTWSNSYTGRFMIEARGVNGSVITDHKIRPAAYTGTVTSMENNRFQPMSVGAGMNVNNGTLTMTPPVALGEHEYFKVQPEAVVTSDSSTYGFRFRFPEQQLRSDNWVCGGMFIAGDWGDTGFYLEVSTTEHIDNIEQRQYRNELELVIMPSDAHSFTAVTIDGNPMGYSAAIVRGQWYDIDIRHAIQANGDAIVTAYVDGVFGGQWRIPKLQRPIDQGKFGSFIRGQCTMEVEYLYAVHNDPSADSIDQATYLDIVDGGYASGYIDRQWRFGPQYMTSYQGPAHEGSYWFTALNNRGEYFLDEFGPVVHEIRDFEVSFDDDKSPAAHSFLYFSNDSKAICTNYWADPFSAKFTLVNTSRDNAILQGDDDSLGENNTISQKMFVYGRSLYQDTATTITKSDAASMRMFGTVSLTIDSRFIETDGAANDLGQWLVDQWSGGSDKVTVTCFGNPLIQLGDLVTMNFPVMDMLPATHKYWVVAIDNQYDTGLETKLTLSRARS